MLTFYPISDVIGNTTCEEDFRKIKNARQYYINFTDYLTTSYLNILTIKLIKLYQLCHKPHGFLVECCHRSICFSLSLSRLMLNILTRQIHNPKIIQKNREFFFMLLSAMSLIFDNFLDEYEET